MSQTIPYPYHHSGDIGRLLDFYSYGCDINRHRSQASQFYSYDHGGQYISYPRFSQESIPRGVEGKNPHQNHPYYYYPRISPHPHPSIPQNPHHKIRPNPYTIIRLQPFFLSILNFYSYVCNLCCSTLPPYTYLRLSK